MNVNVNGPKIMFKIPVLSGIPVTETIVNMWVIMAIIVCVCYYLTRGLQVKPTKKRQIIAEEIVKTLNNFVSSTMGEKHMWFAPYIGTLFTLSMLGSLSSLFGLRPYTADLSVTLGWSLVTFVLVQFFTIKTKGPVGYLKGFFEPVPFMFPINIVGEIANPISMSFRHFGNIAAGMVITSLLYGAFAVLSAAVLKFIPIAFINSIPIFQLGVPAILSIYFDLFTSFLQAYIITMLTMVFVSSACEN